MTLSACRLSPDLRLSIFLGMLHTGCVRHEAVLGHDYVNLQFSSKGASSCVMSCYLQSCLGVDHHAGLTRVKKQLKLPDAVAGKSVILIQSSYKFIDQALQKLLG